MRAPPPPRAFCLFLPRVPLVWVGGPTRQFPLQCLPVSRICVLSQVESNAPNYGLVPEAVPDYIRSTQTFAAESSGLWPATKALTAKAAKKRQRKPVSAPEEADVVSLGWKPQVLRRNTDCAASNRQSARQTPSALPWSEQTNLT